MTGAMSAGEGAQSRFPIVALGAGTHAKSVVEAIRYLGRFEVAAIVDDDPAKAGAERFPRS
jgi:FlaA1/EpsC-like NDP-sugar epimerase